MINTISPSRNLPDLDDEFEGPIDEMPRFNRTGTNFLIALGVGLAVGALVHALRPAPKPRQRFANMLEDIEGRLREIGEPAMNKMGGLAAEGAHAFADGAHAFAGQMQRREAQFEKMLRKASERLRKLAAF